jgi:hypothetical protein
MGTRETFQSNEWEAGGANQAREWPRSCLPRVERLRNGGQRMATVYDCGGGLLNGCRNGAGKPKKSWQTGKNISSNDLTTHNRRVISYS